mmetsp:Transcript_45238/g.102168  ORF Transcript_45238/g.102168 Transcript_45238/m.102168 type:complete len:202 (-) Transcript_45238:53-658(-)
MASAAMTPPRPSGEMRSPAPTRVSTRPIPRPVGGVGLPPGLSPPALLVLVLALPKGESMILAPGDAKSAMPSALVPTVSTPVTESPSPPPPTAGPPPGPPPPRAGLGSAPGGENIPAVGRPLTLGRPPNAPPPPTPLALARSWRLSSRSLARASFRACDASRRLTKPCRCRRSRSKRSVAKLCASESSGRSSRASSARMST